jgi:hypothetical protein
MAQCPFCKSEIDDELARFGGHCPKCVIEIPGDETPTDPGIGKRAEEQVETARQRNWGVMIGVVGLAAVVLIAAGSFLWWRVDQRRQAQAEAQAAAAQDQDFYIASADSHELPTVEQEPEQGAQPASSGAHSTRGGGHQSSTVVVGSGSGSSGSTSSKRYDFIGNSDAGAPELAKLDQRKIDVGPGPTDVGSIGFTVPTVSISEGRIEGIALSDPDEIRKAVGAALKAYSKQMTTCYERRLKTAPELRGTWEVSFTIKTDGRTSGIGVSPHSASDSQLETCMTQSIAAWTFQPMVEPQNFAKPYTFGPAS